MKKILILVPILIIVNAVSCTKQQAPVSTITSDCPDTIKFSTQILPMISDNCFSCHNAGQTPAFNDYSSISLLADDILKALKQEGKPLMPQGGPKLADSLIQQVECWINQGKLNN